MSSISTLHAVIELAQVVGDTAMEYFQYPKLVVETKSDGSPVTAADRNAEKRAREWLAQKFPNDGIVGEELGTERPNAPRRWIIDPIDGTKAFIRGVPLWATLVALVEGETVLAGAINCAAAGEMVGAALGEGAWWNGARCAVSKVDTVARATVLISDDRFPTHPDRRTRWSALADAAHVARTWGDGFGYVMVATGRAEVMADDKMAIWDAAAPYAVVTEAGGLFTTWTGQPTPFGGDGIATNMSIAPLVRASLFDR
jgi:histidinol phosphatase-like enzyme (inositol monophosphatase family)